MEITMIYSTIQLHISTSQNLLKSIDNNRINAELCWLIKSDYLPQTTLL